MDCLNQEQREQKIQLVYAEVIQFEFNLRKIEKMIDANNAEIQYYQREQTKLDQEICTGVKEIENLKETLLMEQTNRTNKIEYDQIAESILTLAPRNELESQMNKYQQESTMLCTSQKEVERLLEMYRRDISSCFVNLNKVIENLSMEIKSRQS